VSGPVMYADILLMILKFSSILHINKPASHVIIGLDHLSFPYTQNSLNEFPFHL